MKRFKHRIAGAFALLLAATTLAGCGCGPFGLSWCGGRGGGGYGGGYGGGDGGGYRGGPGGH